MFVLDTNVVSELRKAKAGKAHRNVATWAAGVPAAALFVSAITILELETGVLLVQRRDPNKAPCSGLGWITMSCLHFRTASCQWTPPWRSDALPCMYLTRDLSVTPSLPPPRWCMA
jgi:hypothetical protein